MVEDSILYGKLGHIVAIYWYLFNRSFQSPIQEPHDHRALPIPPHHLNQSPYPLNPSTQ